VLATGVLLGIAGGGNSGTVLALRLAPPLAIKHGWPFNLVQIIPFGGFIGPANVLPICFHDHFKVTQVGAGRPMKMATLTGSAVRVVGGCVSDRISGIRALSAALIGVIVTRVVCGLAGRRLRPWRVR
jgi:NNP family nitrate/nitrite transporter-like MFS transporter